MTTASLPEVPQKARAHCHGFGADPCAGATHVLRELTPAERHAIIARLAYLNAERRGFAPGGELADWLLAEAQVGAGAGC
jgi:hypothetical protein